MRICFSLTNLELGGAQVFVCRLANHLASKGHEVFIYDHWPEYRDNGMAGMISAKVKVLSYSESAMSRGVIWKINALLKLLSIKLNYRHFLNQRRFFRQMHTLGIEVVNSHMLFSDGVICNSDQEFSFRLVVTFHGEYELFMEEGATGEAKKTMGNVVRKATSLVVTAEKNLRLLPPDRRSLPPLHRIHVGLDPDAFLRKQVTRQSRGLKEEDFVVGMVSRGIPEKGWDSCIEIVKRFNSSHGNKVKLIMIGNGDYLRELVKERSTPEMKLVQFSDNVQDYFSYYQLFDVFLFPTRFPGESFPNVIIESLYWGVPVIASRMGAIEEMIKTEMGEPAGICLDTNSPLDAFVDALKRLVGDDAMRTKMRNSAREAFLKFNIEDVSEKYLKVFQNLF